MKKIFTLLFMLFVPLADAAYTANHSSKVAWINIYNSDIIYFGLESMPSDHSCSINYFVISPNITEKQRDRYFSMLVAARTSGATVAIGYDKDNPDCYANRPIAQAMSY